MHVDKSAGGVSGGGEVGLESVDENLRRADMGWTFDDEKHSAEKQCQRGKGGETCKNVKKGRVGKHAKQCQEGRAGKQTRRRLRMGCVWSLDDALSLALPVPLGCLTER